MDKSAIDRSAVDAFSWSGRLYTDRKLGGQVEVIAEVQHLSHACQFFIVSNMCTVDLSAADHDIGIEASADLSTADLFVTAVTRDWKSLATPRLKLLHRFKYVNCRPVYRRPIIILGSKSLPNYRYCFPSTFGSKFTADLTTADLFISIIIRSLGNSVPTFTADLTDFGHT